MSAIEPPQKIIRKILIINLCGIGDSLFFLPTLNSLHESLPEAQIDYLLRANGLNRQHDVDQMLMRIPFIRNIWTMKLVGGVGVQGRKSHLKGLFHYLSILFKIRREDYDLALWVYSGSTIRKIIFSLFLKSQRVLIHRGLGIPKFLTWIPKIQYIPFLTSEHFVQRNLRFLDFLNIPRQPFLGWQFKKTDQEKKIAQSIRKAQMINERDSVLIGINPGGNIHFSNSRLWPAEYYASLADKIQKAGWKCIFFGTPIEAAVFKRVEMAMETPFHKYDQLSLPELMAVIQELSIAVGNDSSFVHLATLLGTPSLSIHGPSDPDATGPWGNQASIARLSLPCSPCFDTNYAHKCPYHYCLTKLDPGFLFETVKKIVNAGKNNLRSSRFEAKTGDAIWDPTHEQSRINHQHDFIQKKKVLEGPLLRTLP